MHVNSVYLLLAYGDAASVGLTLSPMTTGATSRGFLHRQPHGDGLLVEAISVYNSVSSTIPETTFLLSQNCIQNPIHYLWSPYFLCSQVRLATGRIGSPSLRMKCSRKCGSAIFGKTLSSNSNMSSVEITSGTVNTITKASLLLPIYGQC